MKKKSIKEIVEARVFRRSLRPIISVDHRQIDSHEITEQGQAHSVRELFQDYVLGRLDPSQISGSPSYDPDNSEDIDPMNTFGLTFERATEIRDAGALAYREANAKKTVANAKDDRKQEGEPKKSENGKEDDKDSAKSD